MGKLGDLGELSEIRRERCQRSIPPAFLFLFYGLEAPRLVETGADASQIFGPLSDMAGLLQFLFLLPVPVGLHQLAVSEDHQGLSRAALALGVVGSLTAVLAQALLVARVITFEVNLPLFLMGGGLIGVWMVLASHLGRLRGALAPRLAWLGEITGAIFMVGNSLALLLVVAGSRDAVAVSNFGAFVQQHPVVIAAIIILAVPGLLAYLVGLPVWLAWLGRHLLGVTSAFERGKRSLALAVRSTPYSEAQSPSLSTSLSRKQRR